MTKNEKFHLSSTIEVSKFSNMTKLCRHKAKCAAKILKHGKYAIKQYDNEKRTHVLVSLFKT